MLNHSDIMSTIDMIDHQHLDIRTITMGISLLDCVDIIYIGALDNRMFRFGICMNKLFDSMMSGKPILYAVNAPNNYIEQYSCGISVQAESADALEIGIAQFLKMDDDKLNKLGQNGKNAVLDNYTMEKLAYKFEEVFEK